MIGFVDATAVTWALLAAAIGTLGYWAWSKLQPKYRKYNIPPFPIKRTFLLGHLPAWVKSDDLDNIKKFREKAGDIFSLDLAGNLVVVVSGYDAVKEVVVNRWVEAPDRSALPADYAIGESDLGILNVKGESWKKERGTMLAILRSFGRGENVLEEKIKEECDISMEEIAKFKGQPVDARHLFNAAISSVFCSVMVGKRFDHNDPHFGKIIEHFKYSLHNTPGFALNFIIDIAKHLPFDLFGFRAWMDSIFYTRTHFSVPYINEAKSRFAKGEASTSYVVSYLEKMRQEVAKKSRSALNEENLHATIRTLFGAGTDTVSTAIYWCVLLCLHHPEIQDKVCKEISERVGQNRPVTIHDRPSLPYLEAVIRETQRYASVVSIVGREVKNNFKLNNYTIPADSLVLLNFHSVHHDAKTWGDPEKFRPERFLDAKGNLIHQEELVPFGLGRRMCPGENFAKMELFIFMSSLFQRFRFEPENSSGELPSLRGCFSIVLSPESYKVRFIERSFL
ncbi:cytochrome p450 2j5 [Plakobranchus ocellatus]|uniref:Cytochrome p450 2j5 n=1 Tax=Plakobranchus ocellatus TaxID=259542 RepID=A0AAV3XNT3_9GAST|nr:cytochrome p450 2j5 [Plakobranchus ocellatus]